MESQNPSPNGSTNIEQPLKTTSPLLYYAKLINIKFIAGLIGTLLLVVGIYAGIQLVQTSQLLRKKAVDGEECKVSSDCILLENPQSQGSFDALREINHIVITAGTTINFDAPSGDNGCYRATIDGQNLSWEKYGTGNTCSDASNIQVWLEAATAESAPPSPSIAPSGSPGAVTNPSLSCPPEYQEVKRYSGDLVRKEYGVGTWINTYNFNVNESSDVIIPVWSGVGHPEKGCNIGPGNDSGISGCDDLGQKFEEFEIYLDNQKIAYVPDHGEDEWLFFGNVGPYPVAPSNNPHTITFQHTNNGTTAESVFYQAALCSKATLAKTQPTTILPEDNPQLNTQETETPTPLPSSSPTLEPTPSPTENPESASDLSQIADNSTNGAGENSQGLAEGNDESIAIFVPPEPTQIPQTPSQTPKTTVKRSVKFFGIDFDLLIFLIKLFSISHGVGRG